MPKTPESPTPATSTSASSAPLFKGRYGKGHLFDKHDKSKDKPARMLLGASAGIPAAFSLASYASGIYDQGQYSSCTGWGTAQAIQTRLAVVGQRIELPSWFGLYTVGRALDRAQQGLSNSAPLTDSGAYPSLIFAGAAEGVASISQWPFAGDINAEPDLLELEYASAFKLLDWYRIASEGSQKVRDVMQAIASGYPVVVGTVVDQAFEDYDGQHGVIMAPDMNQALGGHCVHLLGYREDGALLGNNQWGTSWGINGSFWASPSWVASDAMSDVFVVDVAPTGAGGGWKREPKKQEAGA